MTFSVDKHSKFIGVTLLTGILISVLILVSQPPLRQRGNPLFRSAITPPLVMRDGDPYIRALMRMISASESNDLKPYSVIYGGSHFDDFSRHPEKCIRIVSGPNINNCSTAAGRYQMLNTTWATMAKKYHPHPDSFLLITTGYSFEPEYQDQVVHAWLSDEKFWGMNIPQLLKDGELTKVRQRLSSTWTSLGYGIENNDITSQLPKIYARLIAEELVKKN